MIAKIEIVFKPSNVDEIDKKAGSRLLKLTKLRDKVSVFVRKPEKLQNLNEKDASKKLYNPARENAAAFGRLARRQRGKKVPAERKILLYKRRKI